MSDHITVLTNYSKSNDDIVLGYSDRCRLRPFARFEPPPDVLRYYFNEWPMRIKKIPLDFRTDSFILFSLFALNYSALDRGKDVNFEPRSAISLISYDNIEKESTFAWFLSHAQSLYVIRLKQRVKTNSR